MRLLALGLVAAGLALALVLWWSKDTARTREEFTPPRGRQITDRDGGPGPAPPPTLPSGAGATAGGEEPTAADEGPETGERRAAPKVSEADLVVRVVDPGGRPVAGVPLRRMDIPDAEPIVTDGEGLVAISQLRELLRTIADDGRAKVGLPTYALDLPFADPPRLEVTRELLEEGEIVFEIPYTGALEIVVTDVDDAPLDEEAYVDLSIGGAPEDARRDWRLELIGGRATYRHVELLQQYEARAFRAGFEVRSYGHGPGPVGPSGRAEISIRLGSDHPVLVYRAVEDGGGVLADTTLELEISFLFGLREGKTTTDEAGRFALDLEAGFLARGALRVHCDSGDRRLSAAVSLKPVDAPGKHDQGDLVLAEVLPLVHGTVRDASGAAVPNATVGAGANATYDGDFALFERSLDVRGRSGSDGRFVLYGMLAEKDFKVWAHDGSRRAAPVEARAGGSVELVLEEHPELRGRLSHPDLDSVDWSLSLISGEERYGGNMLDSNGYFSMDRVPPNTYDFHIEVGGTLVHEERGLALEHDLDLGEIDLSDSLRRHEVAVALPEGATGELFWRESDPEAHWARIQLVAESIPVLTPATRIDVRVDVPGHREELRTGVSGMIDVSLRPAIRARLLLDTTGELPATPYTFGPEPQIDGANCGHFEGAQHFTPVIRELVFLFSKPGKAEVRWHLERRIENGSIGGGVLTGASVWIEVVDGPGEQLFVLPLDGDKLTGLTRKPPF